MKKIKSRNEQHKIKWARKLDFHNCFGMKKAAAHLTKRWLHARRTGWDFWFIINRILFFFFTALPAQSVQKPQRKISARLCEFDRNQPMKLRSRWIRDGRQSVLSLTFPVSLTQFRLLSFLLVTFVQIRRFEFRMVQQTLDNFLF